MSGGATRQCNRALTRLLNADDYKTPVHREPVYLATGAARLRRRLAPIAWPAVLPGSRAATVPEMSSASDHTAGRQDACNTSLSKGSCVCLGAVAIAGGGRAPPAAATAAAAAAAVAASVPAPAPAPAAQPTELGAPCPVLHKTGWT